MQRVLAVRVHAEHTVRSKRREEDDRRRHEQDQREPEPSDRGGDAAAIRDELRAEHRERDDGVLDAREDRECAEERERGL